MKIAQVSKADSFGGGASRVAEHLHFGLQEEGYGSHHLVSWSGHGYKNGRLPLYGKFESYIRNMHLITKKLLVPEIFPYELIPLNRHHQRTNYNLMHFHDLSSAISPLTLKYFAAKMPIVWTIHDCSAVTAGCLYPMGCEKYKTICFNCPQSGQWPIDSKIDLTFIGHMIKKYLHKTSTIQIVTPSNWMADFVAGSGLVERQKIRVISNGIDTNIFKPRINNNVGLPKDRLKLLLSSGDISDERKGIKMAIEMIQKLKHLNPIVIVVGNISEEAKKYFNDLDTHFAGYISDRDIISSYYSNADAFIFCSIADNQPLAVMESLSSGTPVFGFKTGGVTEMIESNFNGVLVEQGNISELALSLESAYYNKQLEIMSVNARQDALKKYSLSLMLEKHLELYNELVSNHVVFNGRE